MKTVILIVVGSLISFLALLLIALGLLSVKPELFTGILKAPVQAPQQGKTAQGSVPEPAKDSALSSAQNADTTRRLTLDSSIVVELTAKARGLESEVDSLKRRLQTAKAAPDSTAEQNWKSTAKLIEAMSPEEASKILIQMSDTEVKQVLARVKKRQAGKILANLDPDRAAKILR
jgi:flagellar motility protein MotE (MotC chaperone)